MLLQRRTLSPQWLLDGGSICTRCLRRLRQAPSPLRRVISTTADGEGITTVSTPSRLGKSYFLTNSSIEPISAGVNGGVWRTTTLGRLTAKRLKTVFARPADAEQSTIFRPQHEITETSLPKKEELPHRKRQRLRRLEEQQKSIDNGELVVPPDASSRLSSISQSLPNSSIRRKITTYLSLAKPRLSFLIVLTTTTAYAIFPVPEVLSPTATTAPSLSALTLLYLTAGTALSCASANAFNMLFEPAQDAKMSRTRNRPLVRGLLSKRAALVFALACGTLGVVSLYWGVNPTTAALGGANIFLYAGVYTPMKRISAANTWAGALVGAIPPLMGWTAAAGQTATIPTDGASSQQWQQLLLSEQAAGGWLLAALLFAWQFPHFNALSWPVRQEYRAAGLRMLAWTNPARNARVALRYSVVMFPICWALAEVGVVEKAFVPLSGVVNGWMLWEAARFWRWKGEKGSARGLFWASVWHLPVVMVLAMGLKKGLWERVWRGVSGVGGEEEGDDWED